MIGIKNVDLTIWHLSFFLCIFKLVVLDNAWPIGIRRMKFLPCRYSIWFMVSCNDCKFYLHQHSLHVIKFNRQGLVELCRNYSIFCNVLHKPCILMCSASVFLQQRPTDNDRYVKNCRNGRSPKETRWWFHDDKV